jgi:uncharacterized protein (TIGR03435 family)
MREIMRAILLGGLLAGVLYPGAQGASAAAQTPTTQSAGAAAPTQNTNDLTGSWQGTITPPNGKGTGARVLIKITKDGAQGAPYKGTLYMIDADNGRAIGAPAISVHGTDVSFALPLLGNGMTYAGTLNPDGKTMSGGLKPPNGPGIRLNLAHVSDEDAWSVPQAAKLMAKDAHPKFDVVTVKPSKPPFRGPGGLTFRGREALWTNYNVESIIAMGYGLHADQIIGAPDWFKTEGWDVVGIPDTPGRPSSPQFDELSHDLLATRFGLKFHHEQRELSVYVITVAKGGPKLQPTASGPDDSPQFNLGIGNSAMHNMTVANFAKWFQADVLDRPVVDKTGLTACYDFTLKWTPDDSQYLQLRQGGAPLPSPPPDSVAAAPALNDAAQQQLGLRIERVKTMVDVMVIDHAERPSAN